MHFLGKNLRHLRKQLSVTQAELAGVIGKGQTTIGNWENSISEPSLDELVVLSSYFDISLDILVKLDLAKTNYQAEKIRKEGSSPEDLVKYNHLPDAVTVVGEQKEGQFSYLVHEIEALKQEILSIKSRLPDAPPDKQPQ